MFPLCSACADTMNQGPCTQSHEELCIVGTWVVDVVRKAVDMGYGLVDMFEFWEYEVTCFVKDTNSGGLFAEYVNMVLKLKQVSSGYLSCVQSEEDKEKYIDDYRRAEGIALDKAFISKHIGQRTLAKLKLTSMWANVHRPKTKRRQLLFTQRKSFMNFWEVRVLRLETSYSTTMTWLGLLEIFRRKRSRREKC